MLDGLASVLSRIQEIKSHFRGISAGGPVTVAPHFTGVGRLEPARVAPFVLGSADESSQESTKGYVEAVSAYDDLIARAAEKYDIDPALLKALIHAESGFNPQAVSPAGAKGLTQLMPATAAALGVVDPFDPAQSIEGGARYLRAQLDRFRGNEALALAAYNAGPGAVIKYHGIPPFRETQNYVQRVLRLRESYSGQ
ncbi:MAG: lytic transglycosylase domain-containing protein [Armatimonadota bacterium]|nr:lytic transglycosylase domain-containing protein [Armatimonadota bacterium]